MVITRWGGGAGGAAATGVGSGAGGAAARAASGAAGGAGRVSVIGALLAASAGAGGAFGVSFEQAAQESAMAAAAHWKRRMAHLPETAALSPTARTAFGQAEGATKKRAALADGPLIGDVAKS
jgi:hypothetical protein